MEGLIEGDAAPAGTEEEAGLLVGVLDGKGAVPLGVEIAAFRASPDGEGVLLLTDGTFVVGEEDEDPLRDDVGRAEEDALEVDSGIFREEDSLEDNVGTAEDGSLEDEEALPGKKDGVPVEIGLVKLVDGAEDGMLDVVKPGLLEVGEIVPPVRPSDEGESNGIANVGPATAATRIRIDVVFILKREGETGTV